MFYLGGSKKAEKMGQMVNTIHYLERDSGLTQHGQKTSDTQGPRCSLTSVSDTAAEALADMVIILNSHML